MTQNGRLIADPNAPKFDPKFNLHVIGSIDKTGPIAVARHFSDGKTNPFAAPGDIDIPNVKLDEMIRLYSAICAFCVNELVNTANAGEDKDDTRTILVAFQRQFHADLGRNAGIVFPVEVLDALANIDDGDLDEDSVVALVKAVRNAASGVQG